MTLDDILRRNALRFPRQAAVLADGCSRSWAELDARVDRLAHGLLASGLGTGDRIAEYLASRGLVEGADFILAA